jgi:hypothetical protein
VTTQQPPAGEVAPIGSSVVLTADSALTNVGSPSGSPVDHLVSVTLMTSLTDDDRRYAVRMLLSALAEAADGDASHIQMTVKITAPLSTKGRILERANQADAQQATSNEL